MRRVAVDHAAACIDQRPLRGTQCREKVGARRFRHFALLEAIHPLPVAGHGQAACASKHAFPVLYVLRHVEHHRPRPAGAGDFERRAHRCFQFGRIGDQEHVLGHGTHDAGYGRFLERIRADGRGGYLTADHHDGHGIGHGIAHRSHHIGGPRTRSDQSHAHPAAGPGEARGHESRALLVGRYDQRHRRMVFQVVAEYGVVYRQNRAAAIAENRVDALVREDLHQHIRARHAGARERVRGLI